MTREEAIKWLERIEERYILRGDEGFDKARKEALHMAIEALENNDKFAEDLQNCLEMYKKKKAEVKALKRNRGEWIQHVNEPSLWSCSICETVIYSEHEEDRLKFHKWCGCCGADMRERREEHGN